MRPSLKHPAADILKYEIRGITAFADKIQDTGVELTWENIGDPIAKGEQVPDWIRQIIADEVLSNNDSYGYSPTNGLLSARKYIADLRSIETGNNLSPDNVMFFNGLGDAIAKIYSWLNPEARVLGPDPAYPSHSSLEAAHSLSKHLTYDRLEKDNWQPNMEDIEDKVKADPNIVALLLINPGNPAGTVYSKAVLEQFVDIARRYNIFIISDEIYANLVFNKEDFISIASLSGDVPVVILRGISKEIPWPGSRCGWAEFYNPSNNEDFNDYMKVIEDAKMNEVCSTTLPQTVIPKIMSDDRYQKHLAHRVQKYKIRANIAAEKLNDSRYFRVIEPKGAFYLPITFTQEFFVSPPKLTAANDKAAEILAEELSGLTSIDEDKKFCLELLASKGIVSVPLSSGFNSLDMGIRMTLLEEDIAKFEATIDTLCNL